MKRRGLVDRIKNTTVVSAFFGLLAFPAIAQELCLPPVAPTPTDEATARDFVGEFRAEFEGYFTEAQAYLNCMQAEQSRIGDEIALTSQRYERFISDSQKWVPNTQVEDKIPLPNG